MKKLIFLFCICTLLRCNTNNIGSFPNIRYSKVKILSIAPEISQNHNIDSLQRNRLLIGSDMGIGFVDASGKPIHSKFASRYLDNTSKDKLISIFKHAKESDKSVFTGCLPIYREAVIYYDSLNNPIAHINICFHCEQIVFHPASPAENGFLNIEDTDTKKRWKDLKKLFSDNGLKINEKN